MKKTDISEELWFRYLEGITNEEETEQISRLLAEDDELLAEYLAVREATQLTDAEPCQSPDPNLAQKQIRETLGIGSAEKETIVMLPRRANVRKYIAMAAAAALLIGVALFFLFRPDHNENNFTQQEKQRIETGEKTQSQTPETTIEPAQTDKSRQNDMPSKSDTEGVKEESTGSSQETYTAQKLEKNYATTLEANHLTMTKPTKDNYRVLCKNLEKTLNFEWTATNVQALHFVVTDSKGKTLVETKDVTTNYYSLKYSDIYPEKKLTWSLVVMFKDGSREKRNGTIQIDYDL